MSDGWDEIDRILRNNAAEHEDDDDMWHHRRIVEILADRLAEMRARGELPALPLPDPYDAADTPEEPKP